MKKKDFDDLWVSLWGEYSGLQYRGEKQISKNKYLQLISGVEHGGIKCDLKSLIASSSTSWETAEWGFPKGKRDNLEKDMSAAIREFYEETGIPRQNINMIHNIAPIEEVFIGSNFKSYKTKYFLAHLSDEPDITFKSEEVGALSWRNYEETLDLIRDYNYEKKTILTNVNKLLTTNNFIYQM
jgi:ADP-ribose pyrophosphatase YjhB (NUDIX family)